MAKKQTRAPAKPRAPRTGGKGKGKGKAAARADGQLEVAFDSPAATRPKPKPTPKPKPPSGPRSPRRAPRAAPPPALDRELLQIARGAAGTLRRTVIVGLALGTLATLAAGLWSLRPSPDFSSDVVAAGSPFDVAFQVRNGSSWLPLANLRLLCVLDQVRAVSAEPVIVEAANVRLEGSLANGLAPGASGSFTCPLRAALPPTMRDDAGIPPRAEIYFRSRYDLPFVGSFRVTDNSPLFVLNTRLLPPRWTVKPEG